MARLRRIRGARTKSTAPRAVQLNDFGWSSEIVEPVDILSAGEDRSLRLWSLASGAAIAQNRGEHPFTSLAGDVEFTQPWVGNCEIDFNTEGFVHIGMLPELLQDARGDADSDADFDPLLHSAEGYIRMWERAESRGAALSARGWSGAERDSSKVPP